MAKSKSTPRKSAKKKAGKKAAPKTAKKVTKKSVGKLGKQTKKKAAPKAARPKKAEKKVAPKKKAAKKAAPKKKVAKKGGKRAPRALLGAGGQQSVRFDVKFFGGVGDINFRGQNVSKDHISSDSNFSANQDLGPQTVFVDGAAPAGTNGKIQVQVSEGGAILSPFSANEFTGKPFKSAINYTVS